MHRKEGAVNKVVQQIGALPLNSVEFLWMMGVMVLSIIHSHDYRALYGIMNRVGLFSNSTHSIRSALAPLELFFFLFFLFSSSYSFILSVSSHPFIVILLLLGMINLLILLFNFQINELIAVSRIQASWLFTIGYLENL